MTEEEKRIINKLESLIEVRVVDFYENGDKKSETFKPAIYDEIRINSYTSKIILNLIQNQDTEINKLNKAIDRIIECVLLHKPFKTFVCRSVSVNDCNKYRNNGGCNNCIKEYFMEDK